MAWDAHPFNPFNINASYLTYDKTDSEKVIKYFSVALLMPTIIEPVETGIIFALVSKLIINNPKFWECMGCSVSRPEPVPEREDSGSNTTSIIDVAIHVHHL